MCKLNYFTKITQYLQQKKSNFFKQNNFFFFLFFFFLLFLLAQFCNIHTAITLSEKTHKLTVWTVALRNWRGKHPCVHMQPDLFIRLPLTDIYSLGMPGWEDACVAIDYKSDEYETLGEAWDDYQSGKLPFPGAIYRPIWLYCVKYWPVVHLGGEAQVPLCAEVQNLSWRHCSPPVTLCNVRGHFCVDITLDCLRAGRQTQWSCQGNGWDLLNAFCVICTSWWLQVLIDRRSHSATLQQVYDVQVVYA